MLDWNGLSIGSQFFFGTGTGVTGALVVWVARGALGAVWSLVQARAQGSRSVHGLWTAEYEKAGVAREEQARLAQFLHRVWGTIHNPHEHRDYNVRGTLRHGVLVATYELRGRSHAIDRGAFAVRLSAPGDRMIGSYAWTDSDNEVPKAGPYRWTRVKVPH